MEQNLKSWNNHFWLKNVGEKWSRKKYFEIPRAPSELLLPRKAELAWQVCRYLWRGSWNFKIFFSRPLFTIIFKPKIVISRVKILVYFSSHSRRCVTVLLVNWSLLVSCGHMHSTVWSSLCFWKSKTLSKIWKYNRELYERYIEWELTVILRPHRGNYLS